jgi:predicted DNA-binding WGR domain protein
MIRLTRIDPDRNMSRYYQLHIQPGLFGGFDLVREWGRIGSPGTIRTAIYPNQDAATAALADAVKQRQKRGYRTITVMPPRCRTLHLDFASPDAQPARFSAGAAA